MSATDMPSTSDATGRTRRRRLLDVAGLFSRGVAMGAADIVPGVSGGTIALISGIYERLIDAIGSLSLSFLAPLWRGDVKESSRRFFSMKWEVLLPIGSGAAIAILLMSRLIPRLMDEHPGPTFAFFFGLIAASVWIPFARMSRRNWTHFVIAAIAALGAWLFVGLQPEGVGVRVVRVDPGATTIVYPNKLRSEADLHAILAVAPSLPDASISEIMFLENDEPVGDFATAGITLTALPDRAALEQSLEGRSGFVILDEQRASLPWIFTCGAIAICAMILPGVSGAFLLLFLGQYHAVLTALHSVIDPILVFAGLSDAAPTSLDARTWFENVLFIAVFMLGILIGIVSFSRVVRWMLHRAHDATMAALTGLMIGGLRHPAQEVQRATVNAAAQDWVWIGVAVVVGGALVTLLNWLDGRLSRSRLSAS